MLVVEGKNIISGMVVEELSLVIDLVIPTKFKVPDFTKNNGASCLAKHLTMYSRKMARYTKDEKLMIHYT